MTIPAQLRVCASCEWVFTRKEDPSIANTCPKCGFASYGAWSVYGNSCYKYVKTQKPWLDKKIDAYISTLQKENNL